MKILAALLVLAPLVTAQDILFEDDFSDGNADGWTEMVTGATYQVNSALRYEMSYIGSDSIFAFSYRGDNGTTMSESNYSLLFQVIGTSTSHVGASVRYMDGAGTCYTLYLNFSTGKYYILRYDTFSDWTILGSLVNYTGGFQNQTPYWVRFECLADTLRAKIWTGAVSPEPGWMIVRTDGTYFNNGCVALETMNYITLDILTEFDDVVVTAFPVAFESNTWGGIKSIF